MVNIRLGDTYFVVDQVGAVRGKQHKVYSNSPPLGHIRGAFLSSPLHHPSACGGRR